MRTSPERIGTQETGRKGKEATVPRGKRSLLQPSVFWYGEGGREKGRERQRQRKSVKGEIKLFV